MADFTWKADFGAQEKTTPRVLVLSFGDGYEQRAANGIHRVSRSWSLTFSNRTDVEAAEIIDFLSTAGGVTGFTWTPPFGAVGTWKVSSWQHSITNYDVNNIVAEFIEVFD